jgi:hypothetical protein
VHERSGSVESWLRKKSAVELGELIERLQALSDRAREMEKAAKVMAAGA